MDLLERHLGIEHVLIRDEGKISGGDHDVGVTLYDGRCLLMQVAQYIFAAPLHNVLHPYVINTGAQEGHGGSSTHGLSRYVLENEIYGIA